MTSSDVLEDTATISLTTDRGGSWIMEMASPATAQTQPVPGPRGGLDVLYGSARRRAVEGSYQTSGRCRVL